MKLHGVDLIFLDISMETNELATSPSPQMSGPWLLVCASRYAQLDISALGNVFPLFADFQRLLALCLNPRPPICFKRHSERDCPSSGHPGTLDQLNYPLHGLLGVAWFVTHDALFKCLDSFIELGVYIDMGRNVVDVTKGLSPKIAGLYQKHFKPGREYSKLLGKAFYGYYAGNKG